MDRTELVPGKTFYSTSSSDSYKVNTITFVTESKAKKPTKRPVYVFDLYHEGVLFKKEAFKTTYESINDLLKNAWTTDK